MVARWNWFSDAIISSYAQQSLVGLGALRNLRDSTFNKYQIQFFEID
jgi:hypothetical protein